MTSKPHFVLDDDNDEDSEVEQQHQRLPRIVVGEPVAPSSRSSRRGSRDEEERHVGFAVEPPKTVREGGWSDRRNEDEPEQERSKEKHTYPPSSSSPDRSSSERTRVSPETKTTTKGKGWTTKLKGHSPSVPESLAWVPSKLNWKGLRPVIRSTIASWCGLVLSELHFISATYDVELIASRCKQCSHIRVKSLLVEQDSSFSSFQSFRRLRYRSQTKLNKPSFNFSSSQSPGHGQH